MFDVACALPSGFVPEWDVNERQYPAVSMFVLFCIDEFGGWLPVPKVVGFFILGVGAVPTEF
jgi:hypothetical protein